MKNKNEIYVTGHKNPDTDSVCSSIAYAWYLRRKKENAKAIIPGKLNPETEYVLKYFKLEKPKIIKSVKNKRLVLVDHNENSQSPDGIESAEILQIIDHHKINFQYAKPIYIHIEPLGSTATILSNIFLSEKIKIPTSIAGILLSAILSDTVIFKSSTTTQKDIKIAKILAKIVKIKNIEKFGISIKEKKASINGISAKDIILSDFKDFNFSGKKIGIGQIEVCDLKEVEQRKKEIYKALEKILKNQKYYLMILMATDIIKQGSEIMFSGQKEFLEKAFDVKINGNSFYLKNAMSRKKDIVPKISSVLLV